MSKFSEKRGEQKQAVREDKMRRKRDVLIALVSVCVGAISPFVFNKVIIVWLFLFPTFWAVGDLVATFGVCSGWSNWKRLIVSLPIMLLGVVLATPLFLGKYKAEQAALVFGYLEPYAKGKANRPILELGDSWITVPMDHQLDGTWEPLRYQAIKVEVVNGTPLLSTKVKDKQGNLVVDIDRNHWTVSSSSAIVWDKNSNRESLEVLDARQKVVLQVHILPDRVQLQGEWHNDNGVGIRIAKTHAPLVEGGAQIIDMRVFDGDAPGLAITPVFNYPSADHWQELLKQPS